MADGKNGRKSKNLSPCPRANSRANPPPRIRGRGGEQARSILKKPPAKNFRKMFSEKKHGRICFANIRTIHNLTRPPPPESRKIIRAGRSCIFRFSRKRATENICCHAGVCVLCYFPFFCARTGRGGWGLCFRAARSAPHSAARFQPPKKIFPPGAFCARPASAANL